MIFEFIILILCVVLAGLISWLAASKIYQDRILRLQTENLELKSHIGLNENIINQVKTEFSKIALESLKNQQEQLIYEHANDLSKKFEVFTSEEIHPINKLLKDFKESIDSYQKAHQTESFEIKNAISIAQKYAKALTTNQNSKGEFGEQWLEQILKSAGLQEGIHYTKQFSSDRVKPDYLVNLPNDNHLVIDSKVILKNFIEYRETEDETLKKSVFADLNTCVNNLAKKNYEEIPNTSQPGFILMYIPIETCVNMIYTDNDFRPLIDSAGNKNIIIVGTASLLVSLRLVNQLWASKIQNDNVQNIIKTGENLYKNISVHAQNLLNIQKALEEASSCIQTEINRFTSRNNGSIFKEAEKLKDFGIELKTCKTGKKLSENSIPKEFLTDKIKYTEEEI